MDEKKCLNCGKVISKRNKFCNSSCAASYNNKKYPKRQKGNYGVCLNCGNPLKRNATKYCCSKCQHEYRWSNTIKEIESINNVSNFDVRVIKKYMIEKYGSRCSICGSTSWLGQTIPLVLDHIDGNSDNWSKLNLRLVCGNCDMLLPTYKKKNNGNGRAYRRNRYKNGESY